MLRPYDVVAVHDIIAHAIAHDVVAVHDIIAHAIAHDIVVTHDVVAPRRGPRIHRTALTD